MATLQQVRAALAAALEPIKEVIEDLTIEPGLDTSLTPPCIDIYPADPFHDDADESFGDEHESRWTVRARAGSTDSAGQQDVLLQLMEQSGPTSVKALLTDDQSLGDVVQTLGVDGPSGFRLSDGGPLVAVVWTVTVHNKETVYS